MRWRALPSCAEPSRSPVLLREPLAGTTVQTFPGTLGHLPAWFSQFSCMNWPPGAGTRSLPLFALQARGHWFEPSCAHQVRSLSRNVALVTKSKRRAKGLTAGDVQETLDALAGRLSTRSLQIIRNCLERATVTQINLRIRPGWLRQYAT
jgi:hypothetical protein